MTWTPPPARVTLEIEMPRPEPFVLDPATTAVVVVDMEDYFLRNPDRPRMTATIEGNVALLAKAREAGPLSGSTWSPSSPVWPTTALESRSPTRSPRSPMSRW